GRSQCKVGPTVPDDSRRPSELVDDWDHEGHARYHGVLALAAHALPREGHDVRPDPAQRQTRDSAECPELQPALAAHLRVGQAVEGAERKYDYRVRSFRQLSGQPAQSRS